MQTDLPTSNHSLIAPLLAGAATILIFFAGFGAFAALAPLGSAAIASGVIVPDGNRKTVQHLEGGIVREILVRDGTRVREGQVLVRLDSTAVSSEYAQLLGRARVLRATEARLLAERAGAAEIDIPVELLQAAMHDQSLAILIAGERERFQIRREALDGRKAIFGRRAAQAREEIPGHEAEILSHTIQLELMQEELVAVRELFEKGLERRPRLLALERAAAGLEGGRTASRARIARAREAIGEVELSVHSLDTQRSEEVAAELAAVRGELLAVAERLGASQDRLDRTLVTAPVAGTVVELRVRTQGGVLAPGEPILDIVPADDELLIEARIATTDIDAVRPGQSVQVHLAAYSGRTMPRLPGRLREVSADSVTDPRTGQSYYAAQIEVDLEGLLRLAPDVTLTSGMPAEVLIETGDRTLLRYLLDPLATVLRRGLRET
jgi:HlyD family secretion protein